MTLAQGLQLVAVLAGFGAAAPAPTTDPALAARLAAVSKKHLGTTYRLDPLGEGPQGRVDRDPLKSWKAADCVTFVEQCLAEAIAPTPGDVDDVLRRIRYRDGKVAFESRNHYTVADWLPNNRWFVRDVTAQVGGSDCKSMTKIIDRAALFKQRGGDPALGGAPERLSSPYLPRALVPRHIASIPDASLLILVTGRPGIFASHVGFVFVGNGERIFRHASQRHGRVVDEPLLSFLRTAPRSVVGVKVCVFHQP